MFVTVEIQEIHTFIINNNVLNTISIIIKYSKGVDTTIRQILYLKLFLLFGMYLSRGRACIVKSIQDFCNRRIIRALTPPPTHLIFVDFTALQFRFTLFLKRDDDQGYEYIYKEEWKHYKIYNVENGHFYSKILYGALILVCGRHRMLENP